MASLNGTAPARYWRSLPDGRLLCELCPRACRLAEGQRGFCYVRQNLGGRMQLVSWGRGSGFAVDPVEKKPLFHFLPGSGTFSFGTAGCNLGCRFCQNWHLSKTHADQRQADLAAPGEIAAAARRLGCASVSYTYNDPVIFLEFAVETAAACRELGLRNVAVTAGYVEEAPRREFFSFMDAANVDLKAFSERFYRRHCSARLRPVLDTLLHVRHETECWLEITCLVIPGENDSDGEIGEMAAWIARELGEDTPLHLSAFHPAWKMADREPTPLSTLLRARDLARDKGLRYVYTGNLRDEEGGATTCPGCGETLARRRHFQVLEFHVEEGRCPRCGEAIPGVFA